MQTAGINLLAVIAAILYGIVHDQVTARICLEYFTIRRVGTFGIVSRRY